MIIIVLLLMLIFILLTILANRKFNKDEQTDNNQARLVEEHLESTDFLDWVNRHDRY